MSNYVNKILESGGSYEDIVPIDLSLYHELVKELERVGEAGYFNTGFGELDSIIQGFQEGRMYVLSAPTKQGKTTFAQTLMYELALKDTPSLLFSYEMGWKEVTKKFMQMDEVYNKTKEPAHLKIHIPTMLHRGGSELQYDWLFEAIAKAKIEKGVRFVVIDHLHFLIPLRDYKNLSILIGNVVREVKKIAVLTNTAIVLISHIKKIQHEGIPTYEDLRDSSLIAQEADMVLMLHRVQDTDVPKKATAGSTKSVFTEKAILSVELNRDGGFTGKIALRHKNGRFFEWTDADEEEYKMKDFAQSAQKALR